MNMSLVNYLALNLTDNSTDDCCRTFMRVMYSERKLFYPRAGRCQMKSVLRYFTVKYPNKANIPDDDIRMEVQQFLSPWHTNLKSMSYDFYYLYSFLNRYECILTGLSTSVLNCDLANNVYIDGIQLLGHLRRFSNEIIVYEV
jgi:hypothetical protein